MELRQKVELASLIFLAFLSFASYHAGTGSTSWMQFTAVAVMIAFAFVFDVTFTDDSSFIFDPDADNWRRKTEAGRY
jgi:hypothetical protein